MLTILTGLVVVVGLVLTAFGLGRSRGKIAAETTAAVERASVQAEESEKRIEVLQNAIDVHQDINTLPDAAVSERLRQRWRRESD